MAAGQPTGSTAAAPRSAAAERRAGARRAQVLLTLQQSRDGLGVRELATRLGLHENTVRFHLDRLVEDRAVERRTAQGAGPGRPRLTYAATAEESGAPTDRRNYALLARILAGFVAGTAEDPSAAAAAAGEAWGRYRATRPAPYTATGREESVAQLVSLLDEVGFEPEPAPPEPSHIPEVRLRHCPFLEVAQEHQEVACSVHLGLMRGALDEMRSPLTTDRLEPFVEPSLCIARLADRHGE